MGQESSSECIPPRKILLRGHDPNPWPQKTPQDGSHHVEESWGEKGFGDLGVICSATVSFANDHAPKMQLKRSQHAAIMP